MLSVYDSEQSCVKRFLRMLPSIRLNWDKEEDNEKANSLNSKLISTEELIEMVKKKPGLWDKDSPDYRISSRTKFWSEITEEIIPNFADMKDSVKYDIIQQLMKKWYNVRDSYRKSLRSRKSKPYIYADSLNFLDPVLIKRKRLKLEEDEEDTANFICEEKSDEEEVDFIFCEENDETNKEHKPQEIFLETDVSNASRAEERQNAAVTQEEFLPIIRNMLKRVDDEDVAFFDSLIPSVKNLSQSDKLEFRIQVLTILKKFAIKKEKDPFLQQ